MNKNNILCKTDKKQTKTKLTGCMEQEMKTIIYSKSSSYLKGTNVVSYLKLNNYLIGMEMVQKTVVTQKTSPIYR